MNRARTAAAAVIGAALLALATVAPATRAVADTGLGVTSTTVSVSSQGRTFTALLVQPSGSAAGAYPVLAFGHGFVQGTARYASP